MTKKIDFRQAGDDDLACLFARAALAAGPAIMEIYAGDSGARTKADGSPVTLADERAQQIVCAHLSKVLEPIPIVAEESWTPEQKAPPKGPFLLIDPLDGTREFIAHNGEFTVNIAIIKNGAPAAGAVYAPALGKLWFGGQNAYACDVEAGADLPASSLWRRLRTRKAPENLIAFASRSHIDARTQAFLAKFPDLERRPRGSSLKFCCIAEGEADLYPRFGPTMEWDTAAGEAVLRAAGGLVLASDGQPMLYGCFERGLLNPYFIAFGDPSLAKRGNLN